MCQEPCRACLAPQVLGLALFLSIAVTNKGMEGQSDIFCIKGVGLPNHGLKSWSGCLSLSLILEIWPHYLEITECALLLSNTFMSIFTKTHKFSKDFGEVSYCQQLFGPEKNQGLKFWIWLILIYISQLHVIMYIFNIHLSLEVDNFIWHNS